MSENNFYYWHLLLTLNLKVVSTSFSKIMPNVCKRVAVHVNLQYIAISLKLILYHLTLTMNMYIWQFFFRTRLNNIWNQIFKNRCGARRDTELCPSVIYIYTISVLLTQRTILYRLWNSLLWTGYLRTFRLHENVCTWGLSSAKYNLCWFPYWFALP